jgi:hypothetical protein
MCLNIILMLFALGKLRLREKTVTKIAKVISLEVIYKVSPNILCRIVTSPDN